MEAEARRREGGGRVASFLLPWPLPLLLRCLLGVEVKATVVLRVSRAVAVVVIW